MGPQTLTMKLEHGKLSLEQKQTKKQKTTLSKVIHRCLIGFGLWASSIHVNDRERLLYVERLESARELQVVFSTFFTQLYVIRT